ncbi:MAG: HDIG domain-containing protein [Bdellovibrionales bacterium]
MKEKLKIQLEQEEKSQVTKNTQLQEEIFYIEVEKRAKRVLGSALHRFQRPYCSERGIQNIHFSSMENMKRTLGEHHENIPFIEELIGVDLTAVEEKLFLNVSGFDPVRRELTRITLDKLMREKSVNRDTVERLVKKSKKQLFKKIRTDGNRLTKELDLQGVHPGIRDMMGALRYRYSFSQNQYFHCAEVGWLCGLLSSELGLDIRKGRRAGMLHDLGKAMDHSIDGGHAVIGADFIDKHGEKQDIVHAVRAHHYDETPNSDLAYLVIAADAISGARPGARRSTAETYMHKMHELERIGSSMPGVLQTFILSAGREVRVMVDANVIDDQKSMELSQELAKKIEEELVYPGTIRVTVVRETLAVEYAK